MSRSYILLVVVPLFIFYMSCDRQKESKVKLHGFSGTQEVVYVNEKARFSMSRNELIFYFTRKYKTAEINQHLSKQALNYINAHSEAVVEISDTVGTIMVPDSTITPWSNSDSLIQVRNQNSPYSWVVDQITWALVDLAEQGKVKVYDQRTKSHVDHIFLRIREDELAGWTEIALPSDSVIFSKLNWIH